MEKLKLFMIMLVLGGLGLVGCDDNDPEGLSSPVPNRVRQS